MDLWSWTGRWLSSQTLNLLGHVPNDNDIASVDMKHLAPNRLQLSVPVCMYMPQTRHLKHLWMKAVSIQRRRRTRHRRSTPYVAAGAFGLPGAYTADSKPKFGNRQMEAINDICQSSVKQLAGPPAARVLQP